MAFNIEQFKSNGLVYGGARSSLFRCDVSFPPGLIPTGNLTEKMSFVAKSATIPPSSVDSIDVGYFGRKIKVAGDRAFPDWTVMVLNDEDFKVRSGLESWLNRLNTLVGNKNTIGTNPSLYKVDSTITQYSKGGSEVRKYRFVGMFPTLVGAISLDWDDTNRIQTFDVTFAYDYWVPVEDDNGIGSISYSNEVGETNTAPTIPLRGSLA